MDDEQQVHTSPEEGHPAGDGERSDREIGGPTSPEKETDGEETGGGPSKQPAEDQPFDSHE